MQSRYESSMKLKTGIVGLPNVGKSTLFNAVTQAQGAVCANYPFATIEPNIGVVEVPDARFGSNVPACRLLSRLARIFVSSASVNKSEGGLAGRARDWSIRGIFSGEDQRDRRYQRV